MPEDISYTKDEIARQAKKKKTYRPGFYIVQLTGNTRGVNSTHSLKFEQDLAVLKDAEDASTRGPVTIKNFMTLPFDNPNHPLGENIPKTLAVCSGFLTAMGGVCTEGLIKYPRKNADGVMMFQGEPLSKEKGAYELAAAEANESAMAKLRELWKEPTLALNNVCYAKVIIDEKGYNKVKFFTDTLPEGTNVVDPADWFTTDDE